MSRYADDVKTRCDGPRRPPPNRESRLAHQLERKTSAPVSKLPEEVWQAALAGELDAVQTYLSAGGDVNARDPEGRTMLMNAATDGSLELVRLLLGSGAEPVCKDPGGWTALHFAAQEFRPEVAQALLDRGSEVDAQDSSGNTPLWRATFNSRGRGEMIGLLLRAGAHPDLTNHAGVSPRALGRRIANYDVKQFYPEQDV
ncbi:MAG: hypothetical protein NVS2B9_00040 [Myxococcales bacterium]